MCAVDVIDRERAPVRGRPVERDRAAPPSGPGVGGDLPWPAVVGTLLLASFLLRVWGIKHGLPYAYNADENAHFVPKAIGLFGHGWNPDYFVNPPAFTYLLHLVFAVWYGGRPGVSHTFATNPSDGFLPARVGAALPGLVAVGLPSPAGPRAADRRVGVPA